MNSGKYKHKHHLGQNFLRDTDVILDVIQTLSIQKDDIVLEIGPGLGALSEYLIPTASQVTMIEIDTELTERLKYKFSNYHEKFQLINQDILEVDTTELVIASKINKIIGALPYNISKKIIEKLNMPPLGGVSRSVYILQKEVAHSYAGVGTKKSMLHHLYNCFYEIYLIQDIEKSKFNPVPKVDSSIILFIPKQKNKYLIPETEISEYTKFLHNFHRNPRKKLLKNLNLIYPSINWEDKFSMLNLELQVRAEALETAQVVEIFNILKISKQK